MTQVNGQPAGQLAAPEVNAVWYTVLAPRPLVGPGGRPEMAAIGAHATLHEASAQCSKVPGSAIVVCTLVFINAQKMVAPRQTPANLQA